MNILTVQNLEKSQGEKLLFTQMNFGIDAGQKIALIGLNGCGKSTLLRMIARQLDPDSGKITSNNQIRIKFLSQRTEFNEAHTIFDHLYHSDAPMVQLLRNYEVACQKLAENYSEKQQLEMDALSEEMDRNDAWVFESEVKSVLGQLGIHDLTLKMNALSGGMLKKVALAQCMIDNADLMILDEPTNHLDIKTIEWLQNQLQKWNKTLIMVTHDRYFLDDICDTIFEIDQQQLFSYKGNYSFFLEKKEERISGEEKKADKIKSLLRTEKEWLNRQPKARGTKQKARIDKIHEMMDHKYSKTSVDFEFTVNGRRLGKKILELKNISKSFSENTLIDNFSYTFKHQERIGIVGPNGSGKSTLLNMITGKLNPDSGEIDPGINTTFGYFDQHSMEMNPDQPMLKYIQEAGDLIDIGGKNPISAARFLEYFMFPTHTHFTPLGKLSGGERRRMHLVRTLMKNPNFLILDEPTNDLDIQTLTILEDFLDHFQGCLLVVSHDRYFMDKCVDELFIFGESDISTFPGSYTDFILYEKEIARERLQEEKKEQPKPERKRDEKQKLSYKEQKEYEQLEQDIDALETEKSEIENFFSNPSESAKEMSDKSARFQQIDALLAEKMARWEELAERV